MYRLTPKGTSKFVLQVSCDTWRLPNELAKCFVKSSGHAKIFENVCGAKQKVFRFLQSILSKGGAILKHRRGWGMYDNCFLYLHTRTCANTPMNIKFAFVFVFSNLNIVKPVSDKEENHRPASSALGQTSSCSCRRSPQQDCIMGWYDRGVSTQWLPYGMDLKVHNFDTSPWWW